MLLMLHLRIIIVIGLATTLGCSHIQRRLDQAKAQEHQDVDQQYADAGQQSPVVTKKTTHYAVVFFEQGQTILAPVEQQKLRRLADAAKKYGKNIQEIRVLAWADQDDPKLVTKTDSPQAKVASERAQAVRKYLKHEIKTRGDIEIHNMARKPSSFNELLNGEGAKANTFENTGNTPLDNGPKSSLAGNKASKAIVLIRYQTP